MKKIILTSMVIVLALSIGAAFANPEGTPDADRLYKFNIIGVDNPKNDMDQGSGKVIFVDLHGFSQINLVCSDDEDVLDLYPDLEESSFDILDKDATDSYDEDGSPGAILALPDPDLDPYIVGEKGDADVWSAYSIYIRSLGKPEGFATITTCAEVLESELASFLTNKEKKYIADTIANDDGEFGGYASVEQVTQAITERPQGKSVFTNVTAQLLTIVLQITIQDLDEFGEPVGDEYDIYVRVPIFDSILEGEYWEYDNNGLKNLQVWIYDNSTDVSAGDGALPPLNQ